MTTLHCSRFLRFWIASGVTLHFIWTWNNVMKQIKTFILLQLAKELMWWNSQVNFTFYMKNEIVLLAYKNLVYFSFHMIRNKFMYRKSCLTHVSLVFLWWLIKLVLRYIFMVDQIHWLKTHLCFFSNAMATGRSRSVRYVCSSKDRDVKLIIF